MRFLRVDVQHFGCVNEAHLEFGPGLNVLYGPNDIGKSTVAAAMRSVLLIQHTSRVVQQYFPWHNDEAPSVSLVFKTVDQRFWRVKKRFGTSGASTLESSRDGRTWAIDAKAREVDGRLRELLGWGIRAPGGQGAPRGLPDSFLGTVLLGEQAPVAGILEQSLELDSDESGKDRLTAALQAFAQDPMFKRILGEAQRRVDEAFTATGRRKRGRGSPFAEVAEDVVEARKELDNLQQLLDSSDTARDHLMRLIEERKALDEQAQAAFDRLERRREDMRLHAERKKADEHLGAVQAGLDRHLKAHADVDTAKQELAKLDERIEAASRTLDDASTGRVAASRRREEAEAKVRTLQSADAAKDRELGKRSLEKRQLELQGEEREAATQLDALRTARGVHAAAAKARSELSAAEIVLDETTSKLDDANGALEAARAETVLLQSVGLVAEAEELSTKLVTAESRAQEAKRMRDDAEENRLDAQTHTSTRQTPSRKDLTVLQELWRDVELAEARLGGGVSVVIRLGSPVHVAAVVDGIEQEVAPSGPHQFEATRTIGLTLGDAQIDVVAGEKETRQKARALRDRWDQEARPMLAANGFATLEELRDAVNVAEQREAASAQLLKDAEALERQAAALDPSPTELAKWRTRLAEVKAELPAEVVATARSRWTELHGDATRLRGAMNGAAEREQDAQETVRTLDVTCQQQRETVAGLKASLEGASAQLAGVAVDEPAVGWDAEIARLEEVAKGVVDEADSLRSRLERLESEADQAVSEAEAALVEEQGREAEAEGAVAEARDALGDHRRARASAEGELKVRSDNLADIDLEKDRQAVREATAVLAALASPERATTQEDVDEAERLAARARSDRDLKSVEVNKAKGAYETVGGDVIREKAGMAQEALRLAEERERNINVEYAGWQLLVQKLQDAESTAGQHLGQALAQPVTERFQELTGSKYGRLQITPILKVEGLHAAGALREINNLSVGTQEQLATLLRLTVAHHLGSVLVLDDQLTQTDPERSDWFRQVLRKHGEDAQLVVLTCRPLDYLSGSELVPEGEVVADQDDGLVHAIRVGELINAAPVSR